MPKLQHRLRPNAPSGALLQQANENTLRDILVAKEQAFPLLADKSVEVAVDQSDAFVESLIQISDHVVEGQVVD